MGSSHSSHTNLRSQCTSYQVGATSTVARWGDSFEVSMGNTKENDHKEVWDVKYKTIQKQHTCAFNLEASRDNKGVESVHFGISDLANNKIEFTSKITRVSCDGLGGGITGIIDSCNAPMSFIRSKKDHMVKTTIVPYGCSYREGLFVLQMKKKVNSDNHAYIVNMAHYYVTKDVGLSVVAKIHHRKNGFVIEVEGPITHPNNELHKVIVKTRRTGMWSHSACSHCVELKANGGSKSGGSNLSLVKAESSHDKSHGTIVQMVDQVFSSSVKEQYNKGLINSTGYTTGYMNNSIVFIDCNF